MQRAIVIDEEKLGVINKFFAGNFCSISILRSPVLFEHSLFVFFPLTKWREATKNDFEKFRVNFHDDYFQKIA